MSYSGAYSHQVGIGCGRCSTGTGGIHSLGNSPGRHSMQASAHPSHRPGVTHMETPTTATAIRYGSGAPSFRGSERSDSRGLERQRSRNSRTGSRSASAQGITEIPQNVGTSDDVVRMMPAGPEEAQDLAHALDRDANSIATDARQQRKVAEVMAIYQERLAILRSTIERRRVHT